MRESEKKKQNEIKNSPRNDLHSVLSDQYSCTHIV